MGRLQGRNEELEPPSPFIDDQGIFVSDFNAVGVDPRGRLNKRLHWTLRFLVYDWVVCGLLLIISGLIKLCQPFHQEINANDANLSFSVRPDTVPWWLCAVFGSVIPLLVFALQSRFFNQDLPDFVRSSLGLAQCLSLTQFLTMSIKNFVGRPRPNFFQLCQYDGTACQESELVISKAFRSFPSGHSSFAFAGLLFLTLWLLGKSKLSSAGPCFVRFLSSISPTILAGFISCSRLRDHWHHPSDVIAGAIIGSTVAYVVYRLHFPSVWHPLNPDKPYPLPSQEYHEIADFRNSEAV